MDTIVKWHRRHVGTLLNGSMVIKWISRNNYVLEFLEILCWDVGERKIWRSDWDAVLGLNGAMVKNGGGQARTIFFWTPPPFFPCLQVYYPIAPPPVWVSVRCKAEKRLFVDSATAFGEQFARRPGAFLFTINFLLEKIKTEKRQLFTVSFFRLQQTISRIQHVSKQSSAIRWPIQTHLLYPPMLGWLGIFEFYRLIEWNRMFKIKFGLPLLIDIITK